MKFYKAGFGGREQSAFFPSLHFSLSSPWILSSLEAPLKDVHSARDFLVHIVQEM